MNNSEYLDLVEMSYLKRHILERIADAVEVERSDGRETITVTLGFGR
jgi:hypothetical protein